MITVIFLIVMLGAAGVVIDVGQLHVAQNKLQAAANAAALAAGEYLPNSQAITTACTYSGSLAGNTCNGTAQAVNGDNSYTTLPNVTTTVNPECFSAATAGASCVTGTACPAGMDLGPSGTIAGGCNAVMVTEQTSVTPWLMGVLGFGSQTVTATAVASIAGGIPHPLDIEMIDDTTESMQTNDTCGGTPTDVPPSQSGNLTQEDCAKAGIRALLTTLLPCSESLASCGPFNNNQTASPVDEVGLVAFPGLNSNVPTSGGETPDELNCSRDLGTNDTSYASTANYQIVPFSSDFRVSDAATSDPLATLNTNSDLVRSVYWPGDSCPNGGYPIPTSGSSTSISGGTSADSTIASNPAAGITGGASTATQTVNAGIAQGISTNTSNPSGITQGGSTSATSTAPTIGGGPNSGSSHDYRTATTNSGTSIQILAPSNTVTGDFLLVTVTAQGASVTGSSRICDPTGNWGLPVDMRVSALTSTPVIQATFAAFRTAVGAGPYTFDFDTGVGACGTHTLTLAASAVALRYTNVGGVDKASGEVPTTANFAGSAPSTTWPQGYSSGTISSQAWRSGAWYTSVSANCASQTAGNCNTTPAAGTITSATFSFGAAIGATSSYSVTLYKNGATTGSTCTIGNSQQSCTISGLNVAVNGTTNTIVLVVTRTSGTGTSFTGTGTGSVTEGTGSITNYVSLASSCSSTSSATRDDATVASAGTLSSATLTFGANVPVGDTFTVTLFQDGAASGSSCPIAAGSKTCTIAGGLALAMSDKIELQVTRTAGTAAFTTTVTSTTAVEVIGGTTLTAPSVTTTQANDQVVRLFGTGSTFATGNGLPVTIASASTSTGADDAAQAAIGPTGTDTVNSTAQDDWVAQTVTLTPALPTSITVIPPTGYVAGNFLLVTVSALNLGTGVICSPSAANWSVAAAATGSGTAPNQVTQESFYTTAGSPGYTFTFYPTSSCTGTPVQAGASEVAVNYTGVDTATPLDGVLATSASGTVSPLNAKPITPNSANDEVVSLFATDATTLTLTGTGGGVVQNGTWTSTGIYSQLQPNPVSVTPADATSSPLTANWTEQTIALKPALASSITITAPSDYAANTGDVLLVSIGVQNLGSAHICAPDANWTPIPVGMNPNVYTVTSGTLTQETFWTTSSGAYTFNFYPSASCSGTGVKLAASDVATTYDGVDVATAPTATANTGSANPLTALQNPTANPNEEVVSFFATNGAFNGTVPAVQHLSGLWTNVGEDATLQQAAGNQTPAASASTSAAASWAAETVDLTPLLSPSITVTPPAAYVGGGGDLLLVSIAVQGLGTGTICAPDATWAAVPVSPGVYTETSGTLTQEAFYTTTSSASSDIFSFYKSSACRGTPVEAGASAVALNYTGVNPVTPLDGSVVATSGLSSPIVPGQITTSQANDDVVTLYASNAATMTGPTTTTTGSGWTSGGANNAVRAAAGAYTSANATTVPTAASWTTETLALRALRTRGSRSPAQTLLRTTSRS